MGWLAAPTLFSVLGDDAAAGRAAGALFRAEFYVAIVSAPLFLCIELAAGRRGLRLAWPVLIALALAVIELVLQPRMHSVPPESGAFAWLHGAAGTLYLFASLCGLAVVLPSRGERA